MRLEKKIAFVTGAGGGIGRSICQQFLAEGAVVIATDVDGDAAAEAVGDSARTGRAIALQCDVGDSDQVRASIATAVATFGGLNVLMNIAGGSSSADGPVTEAPEEEFWRTIRLDLFGTFMVCQVGIPELVRAGGGSVINMSSMMAVMGFPGKDCYTAAKGGISSLTRSIAAEYAAHGIRANAIAPGLTMTPRVQARYDDSEAIRQLGERHLMGPCHPLDIAHMAVYLASEESRVVTGQILQVDSGVTMH